MSNFLRFFIFLSLMIMNVYVQAIPIIQMRPFAYKQQNNELHYSIKPHTTYTNEVNPLTHYTAQQLASHFQNHKFSHKEILNRLDLYSSDEFIKFIKTYPEYKKKIKELHTKFKNLSKFKKVLYRLIGGYSSRLHKRIDYLYEEIEKQNQESNSSSVAQKRHIARFSSERINEYKTLEDVYKTYTPLLSSAIEKRCNVETNDELQKVLYEESADIKNRAHKLSTSSPIYAHQDTLLDCADAVALYTNEDHTDKAITIADFCWTLLDYGQAIAEGAALGLYNSAQDILTHPIEATVCVLAGKQVLAYQLCKVLYNVAEIGGTALHDYDRACEQWNDYLEPINNLINAINNKEITLRNTLKTGTALIVGYKAQTKLLGGLGKLFTVVKTKAINFAKNNTLVKPTYYLATPEGVILKASHDAEVLGGVSKGVINPSLLLLETTYAKVAAELRKEIEFLQKKYDCVMSGFGEIGYKKLKIDYEHIFGLSIRQSKKGKLDIGGFHLDCNNYIEQSNILQFADKIIDKNGYYQCRLLDNGIFVKNATFFPAHWTREKVVNKIYEAYRNFIQKGKVPELKPNNKYRIEGYTEEGVKIEMFITQKGYITTAYPLL